MRLFHFVFALTSAVFVAASVGQLFGLHSPANPSTCYLNCHNTVTRSVELPDAPINFPTSITRNCHFQEYLTAMSSCLTTRCVSAPDYGYALEYGVTFCKRAGVDVEFEIPQWFLNSPGGAWYLNATQSQTSAATSVAPLGPAFLVAAVVVTLII